MKCRTLLNRGELSRRENSASAQTKTPRSPSGTPRRLSIFGANDVGGTIVAGADSYPSNSNSNSSEYFPTHFFTAYCVLASYFTMSFNDFKATTRTLFEAGLAG